LIKGKQIGVEIIMRIAAGSMYLILGMIAEYPIAYFEKTNFNVFIISSRLHENY